MYLSFNLHDIYKAQKSNWITTYLEWTPTTAYTSIYTSLYLTVNSASEEWFSYSLLLLSADLNMNIQFIILFLEIAGLLFNLLISHIFSIGNKCDYTLDNNLCFICTENLWLSDLLAFRCRSSPKSTRICISRQAPQVISTYFERFPTSDFI